LVDKGVDHPESLWRLSFIPSLYSLATADAVLEPVCFNIASVQCSRHLLKYNELLSSLWKCHKEWRWRLIWAKPSFGNRRSAMFDVTTPNIYIFSSSGLLISTNYNPKSLTSSIPNKINSRCPTQPKSTAPSALSARNLSTSETRASSPHPNYNPSWPSYP
jgi:hypothetical protein